MAEGVCVIVISSLASLLAASLLAHCVRCRRRGRRVRPGAIAETGAYKPDTFLLGNMRPDDKNDSTIFVIPEAEMRRSLASLASLADTTPLTSSSSGNVQLSESPAYRSGANSSLTSLAHTTALDELV